jgi:hypothetical protein
MNFRKLGRTFKKKRRKKKVMPKATVPNAWALLSVIAAFVFGFIFVIAIMGWY